VKPEFSVRLRDDGLWVLSYHGREQFTFPTESEALAALELAAWGASVYWETPK
jgi:hypothetical protein